MAAKKKKSAAAKKKKKKTSHTRPAAANPPKSKKTRKKKKPGHAAASRPRKSKKRKPGHASSRRAAKANPGKKKKKKRAHRKNPSVPMWAMAAIGAVLGLVSFTAVSAGTFALTQRLDPSLVSLVRNRRIAAGLFAVGGVALAFVSPILGAGVAAGGLAVLAGTEASLALGKLIDAPLPGGSPSAQQASQRVNGVFGAGSGRQQIAGVFDGSRQSFTGVFGHGGSQTFQGLEDGQGATAF